MQISSMNENAEGRAPLVGVIDDEAVVRDGLRCLLGAYGYRVATFDSVEAFSNSSNKHEMACVVSGMTLLGQNGLDMQRWMATCAPDIPVVFWTAYAEDIRVRALAEGAFAVMSKPYTDGLLRVIERALTVSVAAAARRAHPAPSSRACAIPSFE
jgi:FixJ family two-component response regulator